jgi:hypothetical protein
MPLENILVDQVDSLVWSIAQADGCHGEANKGGTKEIT